MIWALFLCFLQTGRIDESNIILKLNLQINGKINKI